MLTGYSNCGCQEFIMPEKDNADHSITLDHDILGTTEDLLLQFDIVNGRWRFVNSSANCILDSRSIKPGKSIVSGDIIYILAGSTRIAIIITELTIDINESQKYDVKIGRASCRERV